MTELDQNLNNSDISLASKDIQKDHSLSLDKALAAYRVLHTPVSLSWKQHYVRQTYSDDNLLKCTAAEKKMFLPRLEECKATFAQNVRRTEGSVGTLKDLITLLVDPKREKIKKMDRTLIYTSSNGQRPVGENAYRIWSGIQILDFDIHSRRIAEQMKPLIFERLKKYNWFLGVAFSSSGKGLHVYTKIQVSENEENDLKRKKILYLVNFRHKYSYAYLACIYILNHNKILDDDGNVVDKETMQKWMDLAMYKPQQGAFIGYDPDVLISTHFFEDFIYVNIDNVEDLGNPDVDWVSHPDLKEIFRRWEWFEDDSDSESAPTIEVKSAPELEVDTCQRIHYKHFERWRLANTLVKLYGKDKGYTYMRRICSPEIPTKEIQSDCITAARHDKSLDTWAINQLNKYHGFNIKINIDQEEKDLSVLYNNIELIDNPTLIKTSKNTKNFHITKDQYLGHIKWELLSNIGRITLIESGAGTGKTEMIKDLVRCGKKVMLVMPFISTIKSKVEGDECWEYSYGNRKIHLDIPEGHGLALTVDKFSHVNLMEVKEAGFDYVIVDESHLLFQSEYRPIMPDVIDKIRNTEIPVILMSGTPIGETVFFEDIVHLKVTKDDDRIKKFDVFLTERPSDNMYWMCQMMAKDISDGRRVLFPTNKGTEFEDKIRALVKYFLEAKYFIFREPVINYYKKSNLGEKFMDDVNFNKTIKDTDILMCSTYLSVGVDILDSYEFNIYFNNIWTPQEVEQFANRLRHKDLYIRLFVARKNEEGDSLNVCSYKACDFKLSDDEIKDVHSIIRICNKGIERNPTEYMYNPLISSILKNNKYIRMDEVENKCYLNEIAYKTIFFERKYRAYAEQLPVLAKGMMSYGYEYSSKELGTYKEEFDEDGVKQVDFKQLQKEAKKQHTIKYRKDTEELLDLITEDRLMIYKSVMKGEYDIRKGDDWKEDNAEHTMVVKNVEVFERVIPLFTSMSKMFDVDVIKDIFDSCRNKDQSFNYSAIRRIKLLTNIVYNSKLKRLDLPIKDFMGRTYDFVLEHPVCQRKTMKGFVLQCAMDYADRESDDVVKIKASPITVDTINDTLYDIFKCLVDIEAGGGKKEGNKKGDVKLSKAILTWSSKQEHSQDINAQLGFLDDFLSKISVKEEYLNQDDLPEAEDQS